MSQINKTFTVDRDTKNTRRFQEDENGDPIAVGPLYVQKEALKALTGDGLPGRIRVTIEVIEE